MSLGLRPAFRIVALSLLIGASARPPASAEPPPGWADPPSPAIAPSLGERLAARGIRDTRVCAAFDAVSRDAFIPPGAAERAYDEKPLPAGYAQTISQPYLLARMIEELRLAPGARVLEVGGGSGYQAAILGELAREVFSVGVIPELATTARLRLTRAGYQNVHVKLGDGVLGWREYAPYDAVLVTAIGARVPPAVIEQLAEGGVLVMPVGPPRGRQVLLRGVKKGFKLHAKEVAELRPDPGQPSGGDRRRAPSDAGVSGPRAPKRLDGSRSGR